MAQKQGSDNRERIKELSDVECMLVRALAEDLKLLGKQDESTLRWALSLARVSSVVIAKNGKSQEVDIGHATDAYRQDLADRLLPLFKDPQKINWAGVEEAIPFIFSLIKQERRELQELYRNKMPIEALDEAVRTRPLALALGGGGGTSYIFLGALAELEEAGIRPDVLTGTSMGAILGAYRARDKELNLANLRQIMSALTLGRLVQPLQQGSRFGVPSTFRLLLREAFSSEFQREGCFLRLSDLAIPFRVAVAGIPHVEGEPEKNMDEYSHLLENDVVKAVQIKKQEKSITRALLNLATQPLVGIYLGSDELTKEFDVLDAMGFSSAIPGIFHYDIFREDERMIELISKMMHKYQVSRLVDGGFVDNLPAAEAKRAVQSGAVSKRDPFVLALDGFAPNLQRHWMFLPVMQMASERSKEGREVAQLTITYKKVLSPINIVPSLDELDRVIAHGREETKPHMPFIKKMLEPIPFPF